MTDQIPDPETIDVPKGPFVEYGKIIAIGVAPGVGTSRPDKVAGRVFLAHIVIAFLLLGAHSVAPFPVAPVAAIVIVFGFLGAVRYGQNVAARHKKFLLKLKEENPDMDIVRI